METAFIAPYLDQLAQIGIITDESSALTFSRGKMRTPSVHGAFSRATCANVHAKMPYAILHPDHHVEVDEYVANAHCTDNDFVQIDVNPEAYLDFVLAGEDPFYEDLVRACQTI